MKSARDLFLVNFLVTSFPSPLLMALLQLTCPNTLFMIKNLHANKKKLYATARSSRCTCCAGKLLWWTIFLTHCISPLCHTSATRLPSAPPWLPCPFGAKGQHWIATLVSTCLGPFTHHFFEGGGKYVVSLFACLNCVTKSRAYWCL